MPLSAVLFSGGLDSAVLLAFERNRGHEVQPIHVRARLAWEEAEARAIERLLQVPPFQSGIRPLVTVTLDMRDVYPPTHWAITGEPPAYDTPDEDVYIEGRNIVLISKGAVLCARLGIERLVLGTLRGNPFPDATPEFYQTIARAMSLGLDRPFTIATPLSDLHKEDVVKLGAELGVPMAQTLSCMNPVDNQHCGRCSKCRERHDGFLAAGLSDPTTYVALQSSV